MDDLNTRIKRSLGLCSVRFDRFFLHGCDFFSLRARVGFFCREESMVSQGLFVKAVDFFTVI